MPLIVAEASAKTRGVLVEVILVYRREVFERERECAYSLGWTWLVRKWVQFGKL